MLLGFIKYTTGSNISTNINKHIKNNNYKTLWHEISHMNCINNKLMTDKYF